MAHGKIDKEYTDDYISGNFHLNLKSSVILFYLYIIICHGFDKFVDMFFSDIQMLIYNNLSFPLSMNHLT